MNLNDLMTRIHNDWEDTEVLPVINRVLRSLNNRKEYLEGTPINLRELCTNGGLNNNENELMLKATNYLVHPSIHVLNLRYELYANGLYELTADEVYEAQQMGVLCHPVTGREIPYFENEVKISFVLSNDFINAEGAIN
ncbi:hypothetical protein [Vibrio pectenicida]|uniref:Uncharacterized protein n=1 Tax=Vibrio pectenicida TaxID=62763 RepID=A0A3R9FN72_9VIBR|nr:hypothetical protein [Vibrio pectenicida]RSD31958.1 hypothetical protein EJA03_06220 [Vibrio pectenicida]